MTRLNYFLNLGIAFFAFNTSMHSNTVNAGQGLAFHPTKTWQVSSIKPVSDYAGECIVHNEFNNGFLLQMNGSSNWVQQLNLNIRQNAFEQDAKYDVVLSVPGQPSHTINSHAHRSNIISIPLKGKKELYKNIRERGVLDISIEGNAFRFYMTGFNAAAQNFERCMAGGAPGLVAAKNIRDHVENPSRKKTASEKQVSFVATTEDLNEYEKKLLLNESVEFEQQEFADKDVVITQEAQAEDVVEINNIETLAQSEEEAVAALNREAMELARKKVRDQDVSHDSLVEMVDASQKDAQLNGLDLEQDINIASEPPVSSVETLLTPDFGSLEETKVPVSQETLPVMPQSDMDVAKGLLAEPEKTIKTSQKISRRIETPEIPVHKEFAKAEADFSHSTIEMADSKALAKIVALEKELESVRIENEALNDELRMSLNESKREVMSVETDNWNLERATMRYNEAERQMKKLGQQLQRERAQWAMERKELEMMLFDPALTEKEQLARLSGLEQELAAAKAALEER